MQAKEKMSLELMLDKELRRLQAILPLEEPLQVKWVPEPRSQVSGEVIDNTIMVYEADLDEALETLRHEYVDCLLSRKLVDPLVALINALTKVREAEIYRGKERIVDFFSELLREDRG
jgi:hypothetical protein